VRKETSREADRFGDRSAIVGVEFCGRCDTVECYPFVLHYLWLIPEVTAIDGYVVAVRCEAGSDLVDSFFSTAGYVRLRRYSQKKPYARH